MLLFSTYGFVLQQQCAKYWEDMFGKLKNVVYGDIEIHLEETESFMHMTVRNLSVQKVRL